MKDYGTVQGSESQAKPLIVNKTTVYIHTNIHTVETEYGTVYEYNEIQYDKDEYIQMMAEQINGVEESNDTLYEIEADQEFRICCLEMGMSPEDFDEM